jgi:hypothetical protein
MTAAVMNHNVPRAPRAPRTRRPSRGAPRYLAQHEPATRGKARDEDNDRQQKPSAPFTLGPRDSHAQRPPHIDARGARAAREPHGPRVRARARRLVGVGPRGTYDQTAKRVCECCTRRAADNDANDAEGRVDRSAVRGRRGPPDQSPVINKRKHAGSSERLTGDKLLARGSADDVGRRRRAAGSSATSITSQVRRTHAVREPMRGRTSISVQLVELHRDSARMWCSRPVVQQDLLSDWIRLDSDLYRARVPRGAGTRLTRFW